MPEVEVINQTGAKLEKLELPAAIFGVKVNPSLLHEVVRMYQANKRRGTASTKGRGEVSGSGRKPWRQKGTGRARVGSIRSPLWRKGGIIFGPKPRDYSYALPRKKLKLALSQALSDKLNNGELMVADKIEVANPRTKEMARIIKDLNLGEKVLLVVAGADEKLKRASRNIPSLGLTTALDLNAYQVLWHHKVILTKEALAGLEQRLMTGSQSPKQNAAKSGEEKGGTVKGA